MHEEISKWFLKGIAVGRKVARVLGFQEGSFRRFKEPYSAHAAATGVGGLTQTPSHKGTAPGARRTRRNYAAGAVRNRLRNRVSIRMGF